jgi:2-methylcitrate dehydratase PrpD
MRLYNPERMTAARTLSTFASGLRFGAIPALDRERARQCIVDAVGVSLLGGRLPWGRAAADYARHYGGAGTSRIIGRADRVSAPLAALANGVFAHAFELDSLRKPGAGVHPGAALVPVALAIGEEVGASGQAVLTAIVAGCEVMFRIGAATKHTSEHLGFHAPGLTGPFGAAVTAASLIGLDAARLTQAMGIAGSLSGGLLAFAQADNGAMVKRLHLGRAAEAGILAARLAERGFEGPDTVLEGGYGFLEVYCEESDPALLTAGLGEQFETRKLCIKRYPCHVTAHTPLLSIEVLRREHGFSGDDVASVVVRASAKVVSHHADTEPSDTMAAQYSVPWCVAVALRADPTDPESYGRARSPIPRCACCAARCAAKPCSPRAAAGPARSRSR